MAHVHPEPVPTLDIATKPRRTRHAHQRPKSTPRHRDHCSRGAGIANVELDVGGQRVVASVTVEAVDELGVTEGAEVTAVIKASDVMVAEPV